MHEGEHFRDIYVRHGMHDRIEQVIDEDHCDYCACCLVVAGFGVVSAGTCPTCEEDGHSHEGDKILGSAAENLRDES